MECNCSVLLVLTLAQSHSRAAGLAVSVGMGGLKHLAGDTRQEEVPSLCPQNLEVGVPRLHGLGDWTLGWWNYVWQEWQALGWALHGV